MLGIFASLSALAAPTVSLAWDPSPDADVTNYRLYWGPGSGNYNGSSDLGNVTNTVFTQLVPGGHYYFVVTAFNAGGAESDPSNEIDYLVPGGNSPPAISDIQNQTIIVGTAIPTLPFIVGDAETNAASLTVIAGSSNPTLVPVVNISFGGSGANRTITVVPVSGQIGVTTITVTVSDGQSGTASDTFMVTVNPNTAPNISDIASQTIQVNGSTPTLDFTVSDGQTVANALAVTATSSNPTLVPSGNIVLGGSGTGRTVRVTPASNQNGTATVTLTVTDAGGLTDSASFLVTVDWLDDTYAASSEFTIDKNSGVVTASIATLPANSKSAFWSKSGFSIVAGEVITLNAKMYYNGSVAPVSIFVVDTETGYWLTPERVLSVNTNYTNFQTELIVWASSPNATLYVVCGQRVGTYQFQEISITSGTPLVSPTPNLYLRQLLPKQISTSLCSAEWIWEPALGSQGYVVRTALTRSQIEKGDAGTLLSRQLLPANQNTYRHEINAANFGGIYVSVSSVINGIESAPWITWYLPGDILENADDLIPPLCLQGIVNPYDVNLSYSMYRASPRLAVPAVIPGEAAGPIERADPYQYGYGGYGSNYLFTRSRNGCRMRF